jgi:ABC-type multidrug transport system, ATPase component
MCNAVLQTNGLTKTYHGTDALTGVSISLQAGKIYGLIGQNGAGKSTLMRLVTGLAFPTAGGIALFGQSGEKALRKERRRIGSMIEYPGFLPNMTAKENLRARRIPRGVPDPKVEDELLAFVGLRDTGKKKVRNFSLGMKQRLGIASALLGSPELLILDEPVNGLDPLGVVEIRKLIKSLCAERQMTVLISSHNLPELYQTATDYIFIHKGRIQQALSHGELEERCRRYLNIGCLQPEKLASVLELALGTQNYKVMPDKSVRLYDFIDEKEKVGAVLYENGIAVTNLSNEGDTLEEYFVSMMQASSLGGVGK